MIALIVHDNSMRSIPFINLVTTCWGLELIHEDVFHVDQAGEDLDLGEDVVAGRTPGPGAVRRVSAVRLEDVRGCLSGVGSRDSAQKQNTDDLLLRDAAVLAGHRQFRIILLESLGQLSLSMMVIDHNAKINSHSK